MDFNNQMPDWKNEGAEPSAELKTSGFQAGYKPPAGIFNYFWSLFIKAISELQTLLKGHAESKENPHGVTAAQIGLDKVNNTPDSEKNVSFASEAGVGRKVEHDFILRFKGGTTEGTDLFTYNGSTGKSVNITPARIGAAALAHTHTLASVAETEEKRVSHLVEATSADGIAYTATVEGVTELLNGMEITIIPDTKSTAAAITLDVNGLGAVPIRRPLSFSTFVATSIDSDKTYFLSANTPCRLMYHANYTTGGIWLMADKQKTSAQDLYGNVPIENGGTGASTAEKARENLDVYSKVEFGVVDLGTAPIQFDPSEFTSFVVEFVDSNRQTRRLTYTNVVSNPNTLDTNAAAFQFDSAGNMWRYNLHFYWGSGGYMVDSTLTEFAVSTGNVVSSTFPYSKIYGVKLPL